MKKFILNGEEGFVDSLTNYQAITIVEEGLVGRNGEFAIVICKDEKTLKNVVDLLNEDFDESDFIEYSEIK